jgi:uncharacterized membrane protein
MTNVEISFGSQFPAWVLFLAGAVLLGTAVLFYARVRRVLSVGGFALLMGLRVLAVLLLLLAFFKPTLSYQRELVKRSDLVFLIDVSKSMGVHDYPSQPSRLEMARRELVRPGGLVERLSKQFNVRLYRFDAAAEPVADVAELEKLQPVGDATAIVKAILAVLERQDAADLAGVVVVTDGNDNAAKDLEQELAGVKVPLFFVGVGTKSREGLNYRDVMITDVKTRPDRFLTVNNKAYVDVYLKSVGYPSVERTVTVAERGGQEKGHANVVLDSTGERQKAVVEIIPTKLGKFVYDVAVPVDSEERFADNNRMSITVHVIDPKIRVLYVDKPRDEYKELLRTLSRDPNVDLLTLVNNRVGSFTQGGNIHDVKFLGFPQTKEELATFDVIVMGSVKRAYFSGPQLEAIREFVKSGKGFVMLGGTESFGIGGYGGTPVDEVLPVECGGPEIGQERDSFVPALTPEGMSHPIFSGCEQFFVKGAKGAALDLQGFNKVARVMPGSAVLAVNPSRASAPVFVVRDFGKGRTAAFTSTGTYNWYRLTQPLGEDSPYVRFWGQMMRWLAGREAKERAIGPGITVMLDKDHYDPGDKVRVTAHVSDREGLATDKADVVGEITGAGGKAVRVHVPFDAQTRAYAQEFEPAGPGEYSAKFTAKLKTDSLGEAKEIFTVGKPSLESEQVDLNEALLRRVAEADRAARLYCPLVASATVQERLQPFIKRQADFGQWKLTDRINAVLFIAFVALLSVEWILRKRWQLL